MRGTVKFFNLLKGYGFIRCDDEKGDVFVNIADIEDHIQLFKGDRVSFEIEEAQKGPKAVKVTKIR